MACGRLAKSSGNVSGLEVIPLSELKRPALDVVPPFPGFSGFPSPTGRAHLGSGTHGHRPYRTGGKQHDRGTTMLTWKPIGQKAWTRRMLAEVTFRVFGSPPEPTGRVGGLMESKNGKPHTDLGEKLHPFNPPTSLRPGQLRQSRSPRLHSAACLSRMDVTVKTRTPSNTRQDVDAPLLQQYGGLIVAAKTVRGECPSAVHGRQHLRPQKISIRTTFE
jgi:cobaltochelatase CobN